MIADKVDTTGTSEEARLAAEEARLADEKAAKEQVLEDERTKYKAEMAERDSKVVEGIDAVYNKYRGAIKDNDASK